MLWREGECLPNEGERGVESGKNNKKQERRSRSLFNASEMCRVACVTVLSDSFKSFLFTSFYILHGKSHEPEPHQRVQIQDTRCARCYCLLRDITGVHQHLQVHQPDGSFRILYCIDKV